MKEFVVDKAWDAAILDRIKQYVAGDFNRLRNPCITKREMIVIAREVDKLRKENEALKAREAELMAHVERLRSSVFAIVSNVTPEPHMVGQVMLWRSAANAVRATPQQSLADIENETLEKVEHAVKLVDIGLPCKCLQAIRAMKEEA